MTSRIDKVPVIVDGEIIPPDAAPETALTFLDPLEQWEEEILYVFNGNKFKAIDGVIGMGLALRGVKSRASHGRWLNWLGHARTHPRTGQILMQIASDENILRHHDRSKCESHDSHLPSDKIILAEICGLPGPEFDGYVADGVIHPDMKRGDVRRARIAAEHETAEPRPLADLPEGRYRAILADPPWTFESWGGGNNRSADNHYPTMTLSEIEMLPVMSLAADDCVLFLWVTSDQLINAPRIMLQWGFALKTTAFVWVKDGGPGKGYWTRKGSEICLLGTRGSPERVATDVSEVVYGPRYKHSMKPIEVYERIERLVNGPYIELFARHERAGWTAWGNHPGLSD